MTFAVPEHVPWLLHRVAVSGKYHDAFADIRDRWSLDEVADAHEVLDGIEAAEAEAGAT